LGGGRGCPARWPGRSRAKTFAPREIDSWTGCVGMEIDQCRRAGVHRGERRKERNPAFAVRLGFGVRLLTVNRSGVISVLFRRSDTGTRFPLARRLDGVREGDYSWLRAGAGGSGSDPPWGGNPDRPAGPGSAGPKKTLGVGAWVNVKTGTVPGKIHPVMQGPVEQRRAGGHTPFRAHEGDPREGRVDGGALRPAGTTGKETSIDRDPGAQAESFLFFCFGQAAPAPGERRSANDPPFVARAPLDICGRSGPLSRRAWTAR